MICAEPEAVLSPSLDSLTAPYTSTVAVKVMLPSHSEPGCTYTVVEPPADTPLTHRVAGAQLPTTDVVQIHDQRGRTERPPAAAGPAPSPAAYSAATNVHTLLTTFTAGVQRGLEETRRRKAAAAAGGNGHRGPH